MEGWWKLACCQVSMWHISEVTINWFLFFIISKRREGLYWEGSGKISKLKNNFLQPIMKLIIFCNLKIFILHIAFLWFIVRLLIVFNQIYSYDVHYILYHCALRTDESEISNVMCKYVCPCDKGSISEGFKRNVLQNVRIYIAQHFFLVRVSHV